uniref:Serpin domain-containing protein n=1 Tax=Pseudonaja textilis TaxID=8673 RepID=A0A670ZUX4_PSETE
MRLLNAIAIMAYSVMNYGKYKYFEGCWQTYLYYCKSAVLFCLKLSGSECDKSGGFHTWFNQLLSALRQPSKYRMLKMASRIYGSKAYHFLECIKELYNCELESVDFMNANEEVRRKINSWVERKTNGKILYITNFFPANSIDRSTALVLLNTVYFQGMWKRPFNPKDTQRGIFWTCKVWYINNQGKSQFCQTIKSNSLVEHRGNTKSIYSRWYLELSDMIFLVPESSISTDEIITNLTYERLQEWTDPGNMKNVAIKLSMPKFSVQNQYPLKGLFSEMGVKNLFIPGKADLSGMTGNNQLVVSQIFQAFAFTVSEEGSEVSGASRTEVVSGSHSDVKINKPFWFALKHKRTNVTLCLGRICEPNWKGHPK